MEDATSVPVMQARHVLHLLSQHRLALTASCLRYALLVGLFWLYIGLFCLCISFFDTYCLLAQSLHARSGGGAYCVSRRGGG